MKDFFRTFVILSIIAIVGLGTYYYFNNSNEQTEEQVDDQTNIENIVKSESNSQEDIEGTVVAKRTTDSSLDNNESKKN